MTDFGAATVTSQHCNVIV